MSRSRSAWRFVFLLAGLLAVACTSSSQVAAPPPVQVPAAALAQSLPPPSFPKDVQPIFNRRCIACHGCLGSPCNLKLDSFEGADRGGFGINPYSDHLGDSPRTDMDAAATTAQWRGRGFYPVLGHGESPQERLDGSLMYRLLAAGTGFNQPGFSREALTPVYAKRYAHACPATPDALDAQLAQNPARGMPFGLPAVEPKSFETLARWIGAGAPGPTAAEREVRGPAGPARRGGPLGVLLQRAGCPQPIGLPVHLRACLPRHPGAGGEPRGALSAGAVVHPARPAGVRHRHGSALRRPLCLCRGQAVLVSAPEGHPGAGAEGSLRVAAQARGHRPSEGAVFRPRRPRRQRGGLGRSGTARPALGHRQSLPGLPGHPGGGALPVPAGERGGRSSPGSPMAPCVWARWPPMP